MAYSLNFNGGYIQIPKITLTGDFVVSMRTAMLSSGRFFFGSDNTTGSLELYRNNAGQVALYIATVGQFSGTTALSNDALVPDVIVVQRVGTSVTIRVNGILQGTATFSGNMHINFIGWRSGWANLPVNLRLYYLDIVDNAVPANSLYYDPSLSNGTGTTLLTRQGTNAGSQFNSWPSDNSEWIYYFLYEPIQFVGLISDKLYYQNLTVVNLNLSTNFNGNSTPFTYTVVSGTLPAGLSINSSTGIISGTVTALGQYSIKVRATDAMSGIADTNTFVISSEEYKTFDGTGFSSQGFECTTVNVPLVSALAYETSAFENTAFEMVVVSTQAGTLKLYLTGTWQAKPIKRYDSTAWVTTTFKRWNGTSWI